MSDREFHLRKIMEFLEAEKLALRAALAESEERYREAIKDKERLDSGRIMLRVHDSMEGWKTCEFIGQDLRAAIDAATKEQP